MGGEDGDTDLDLIEGETTSETNTRVEADGRATNDGAELVNRARERTSGLADAIETSDLLLGGLIKPCLNSSLPVLVEVDVGNDFVGPGHSGCFSGST